MCISTLKVNGGVIMTIDGRYPDSDDDFLQVGEPDDDYDEHNVCPKGHVGRGIMLESEPIKAANGDMIERIKWECELCGEVWWENENP
jgi:hypothetical protein